VEEKDRERERREKVIDRYIDRKIIYICREREFHFPPYLVSTTLTGCAEFHADA
jgi:hypothetical protein